MSPFDASSAGEPGANSVERAIPSPADFGDAAGEYAAIMQGAAVVDLGCRSRLELTGNDRATFLHNLCTNDIRKLPAGSGCEAYFLNVQGKILAHTLVLNRGDSIVLETVPGATTALMEHLERYHIREAVEICDRGSEWGEILLAGLQSAALLAAPMEPAFPVSHLAGVDGTIAGALTSVWRIDLGGLQGFLLFCPARELDKLRDALIASGVRPAGTTALEVARIESGWPLYGQDITDRNLPQEVARDAAAISFVKGCYLGQETVARIDALGHVNKLLVSLRFGGTVVPQPGAALSLADKNVGEVTSACHSPRYDAPIALGYVRRGSHGPGTRLESPLGSCQVLRLE